MRRSTLLALLAVLAPFFSGFAAEEAKKDPNAGLIIDPVAAEVWTTESGTKYHTKDCKSAKVKTTYAKAIAEGDTACATCTPGVYDATKITVFTGGEGGKKYHLFNCRYAKQPTTLAKAVADGLAPCGTCKAPALWKPADAKAPSTPATAPATATAPAPAAPVVPAKPVK